MVEVRTAEDATLGRGRGVCSHAVKGGGLVGIGLCFTGAVRFTALHLSATFDERPFVGPLLEYLKRVLKVAVETSVYTHRGCGQLCGL